MKKELEQKKKETINSITGDVNDSEVVNEAAKAAILESLKFVWIQIFINYLSFNYNYILQKI